MVTLSPSWLQHLHLLKLTKIYLTRKGECAHFEIIELPGAKISKVSHTLYPILEFLSKYNKVQILCVAGVNDFLATDNPWEKIMSAFENFADHINVSTNFQNINMKFIEIPLIPSISHLKLDSHVVRKDRTQDILKYNDLISGYNNTVDVLQVPIPSLKLQGVKRENDEFFPESFSHVPELWDRWDELIPKKNCVHLAAHVKRSFWTEVKAFFDQVLKK